MGRALALQLAFLAVLAPVLCAPGAAGQSTCRIRLAGTGTQPTTAQATAAAIRSASVQCTGADVAFTGPVALDGVGTFTGATFTVNASAPALLTFSGTQLTIDQSSLTNLNLGSLSAVAALNTVLNVTRSTFSGNTIGDGGSVLLVNSTDTTISASVFEENTVTEFGGAMAINAGSLTVQDSTFTGNSAGASGGAISFISNSGSTASFRNVTLTNNTAACLGGGTYLSSVDSLTFSDSLFGDNTVSQWPTSPTAGGDCLEKYRYSYTAGNGLYAEKYSALALNSTTFDGNGGNGDGGAVFLNSGIVTRFSSCNITNSQQINGRVGGVLIASGTTVIVDDSNFINNTGLSSGGILIQRTNAVNVTNSNFRGNRGLPNPADGGFGGGLQLFGSCSRSCFVDGNVFVSNVVPSGDGGGMYASAPRSLSVTNNLFDSNRAGNTGGGLAFSGNGEAVVQNTLSIGANIFRNNTAAGVAGSGGGLAFASLLAVRLRDSVFEDNEAAKQGGGVFIVGLQGTASSMSNCTFLRNTAAADPGAGGGMYVFGTDNCTCTTCRFTNNTAGSSGGGAYLSSSRTLSMRNASFEGNTASVESGALHADNFESLDVTSATFENNTATAGFGGATLINSYASVNMTDCTFNGNIASESNSTGGSGGSIWSNAGGMGQISIASSQFSNNAADVDAGAVFLQGLALATITSSNFTSNTAGGMGGALSLADSAEQNIMGSRFTLNSAQDGGGLALNNVTQSALLTGITVSSNTATRLGGGLYFSAMPANSTADITKSTISNNTAAQLGGGIAFVGGSTAVLTVASSTVSDNKADAGGGLYGDGGAVLATSSVRELSNTASNAATANVGCGSCSLRNNGAAATSLSNAPTAASLTGTTRPGVSPSGGGGSSGGGGLSGGAIAGIVIGVLAGLLLLGLIVWFLLRRRRRRRGDVEMARGKGRKEVPVPAAVAQRSKVPSAFSEEGNGSFWSNPRSTPTGSISDLHSQRLDELSSHAYSTDKSANTADTYTSRSSAPLINLHSGTSNGTQRTDRTDVTFPNVPWSEWQIDARDIQVARRDDGREWKLGGGAFGEVYKAMLKGVNPVAVKVLRDQSYTSRDEFSKEVALLKALHNSNIVQFQGACVEEDKMLLITEYMDGGDLFKAIARKQVSWNLRGRTIAIDVLRGLHFLHSKRIVHMDLKSPNILLTRHGDAKLADVGLAKVIRDRNYITQVSVIGTFAWAAPEVLTNEKCTEKADIFSFGIVLWEIVTGEQPVRGGRRDVRVPEECSQEVADIIDACLQTDSDKRPTASAVLEQLDRMNAGQDDDRSSLGLG